MCISVRSSWRHHNEPASDSTLTTQVLVVGSGAIGSVFARLLVEAGCQVMMIDAGPALSDPPGDHLRNGALAGRSPDDLGPPVDSLLRPISIAADLAGGLGTARQST